VWQSFLSMFPHLLGGTMATSPTCCHLPGKMLNSAAECADRARIGIELGNPPLEEIQEVIPEDDEDADNNDVADNEDVANIKHNINSASEL
jgi:hypothetical protein